MMAKRFVAGNAQSSRGREGAVRAATSARSHDAGGAQSPRRTERSSAFTIASTIAPKKAGQNPLT